MDPADKQRDLELLARKQRGWAFLEQERRSADRVIPLHEAIAQFDSAYEYAKTLPPRQTTGLVEFHKAMKRQKTD